MTRPFEVRVVMTYAGRVRARSVSEAEHIVSSGRAKTLTLVDAEYEVSDPRATEVS